MQNCPLFQFCALFLFLLSAIELMRVGSDSDTSHVADVIYVSSGVKAGTFVSFTFELTTYLYMSIYIYILYVCVCM